MRTTIIAAAAALLAAACGSSGGKEATETKDIGASGYVVDAPKSWKITEDMEGFWSLEDGRGKSAAQLISTGAAAPTLDELAQGRCGEPDQKDVVADQLPSGTVFVTCRGPSQGIKMEGTTITTTKFQVVATGGAESLTCSYETDDERRARSTLEICKSIRTKK